MGANRKSVVAALWGGAAILIFVLWGLPTLRGWRSRESELKAARTELAQLAMVVQQQPSTDSLIQARESALALSTQRVLRARSRALAASALQSLVQEMADASNVTVTRLDVASADSTANLPITLSANGDIHGLAALLQQFRNARYVLVVDKMQVQNNSALRGAPDVLQIALSLHAPVLPQ